MAVQYAPLFALETQFQAKNGRNLTGGFLRVFLAATDDPADTYSDYNGTRNPDNIVIDDDGRAVVICDKSKAYRLEVYDADGMLMWTEEPVFCSGSGGAGMSSSSTDIISTDGTIVVEKSTAGSSTTFDIGLGVDMDRLDPSCLSADATPRNSDGKFVFGELSKEGDLLSVDNYGCVRCEPAWYHFTAIVELSYDQVATNASHQITLYTTLSNSVVDFDLSYAHRESIELSGDIHVVESNSEFVLGVTGLPNGVIASLVDFDIHAITGHEQSTEYTAGNGINIADHVISADLDVVQHKLTAGQNITITNNVISAENLSQEQSDWTEDDSASPAYIKHKPDLDQYATQAQLTYGLAGKQDVISDLAQIRSGATAGASAVQPADLASVATTGSYEDLNHRPNLTVYATKTEVNTGLAAKQDVISDLSAIRAGAQAGSTAVQPAALDSYATKVELNTGLSGKQDTINDLSTIRSGAAAGATALQPSDVATVATTGDYDDLSHRPTIPSGAQLVPAATSADADKVLTVDAQGTPAWASAQAPISAGTGIDITNNVVSVDTSVVATQTDLAGKQDTISDLATIRSGAAEGATAVQPGDLAAVATTGAYSDLSGTPTIPTATSDLTNDSGFITLSDVPAQVNADWNSSSGASKILNKPTIPSGAQLVPAATSADADKVLTVDAQGTPAWAAGGTSGSNVFMATSTTTFPELWQAFHEEGKIVYCTAGSASSLTTPYFLQTLKANDSGHTTGTATFVQFNRYSTGRIEVYHATVTFSSSHPTLGTVTFTRQVVVPDNPGSHVGEYLTAQSNGSMTFATVNQVPPATFADANKVLTVNFLGAPAWASAQAPISAGNGIDITNNVVSAKVDGTTVTINASGELEAAPAVTVDQTYNATSTNPQSGTAVTQAIATKEDAFDVGTGLEMDTSGSTPTLQVEAPVDIVAGPGIVIDNPDGNTLRVSVDQAIETVLWEGDTQPIRTSSITINLSETVMNFELIRFEGLNSYAGITDALKFANTVPANSEMCFGNNLTISNGTIIVEAAYATVSGSGLTLIGAGRGQSNSSGQMSFRTDRGPTLYKVVGIHRIAGGN